MNNTQCLMIALGWQGGTVHQVSEEIGVSVQDILYKKIDRIEAMSFDYQSAWFAVRTCSQSFFLSNIAPKQHGNVLFWHGVIQAVNASYPDDMWRR